MVWVALAVLRGARGTPHRRAAARALAGLAAESAIVNLGVKSLFRRVRPVAHQHATLKVRTPRTSSFPSGHATSAFCAAALLSDGDPALRPAYYALAAVVAASRIHVGIHHPSDVAAGVVVGAALGQAIKLAFPLES